jgi:hypothetical protein
MRRLLIAVIAVSTIAGAGCGGADSPTAPTTIAGTYTLRTINGSGLPFVLQNDASGKMEMMSGTVTLRVDNTFTDSSVHRFTDSGKAPYTAPYVIKGNYTQNGAVVAFKGDLESYSMSVSSNTLTLADAGFVVVYAR